MTTQNRKIALANIIKQAELDKLAEEIVSDVNLAEINDGEEYANKIFEMLLNDVVSKIKVEGLD